LRDSEDPEDNSVINKMEVQEREGTNSRESKNEE
jgi:hypothetical protein